MVFTLVLRALRTAGHGDRTSPADYRADDGDTSVSPMRELIHRSRAAAVAVAFQRGLLSLSE